MKRSILLFALSVSLFFELNAQTQITFYTNHGSFETEMYDSLMPITTGNFISLANNKFYDGKKFYRVIPNFVIQGGNKFGNGNPIPDEFDSTGTLSNIKMTISMANSGPNTGSSEFFINLKNNTFLDYDKNPLTSAHPIFGIVKTGWQTVDSIAMTPTNANDAPITDVVMDSVRVTGSYLSDNQIKLMQNISAIYPNPITNQSILDIYANKPEVATIRIYNINGILVYSTNLNLGTGKTKIPLSDLGIDKLPSGAYNVSVIYGHSSFAEKVIKLE